VIKKYHPHQKCNGGYEVLVFEKSDGFHSITKILQKPIPDATSLFN